MTWLKVGCVESWRQSRQRRPETINDKSYDFVRSVVLKTPGVAVNNFHLMRFEFCKSLLFQPLFR